MLERSVIYKANNEEELDLAYILYLPTEYEETDRSFPLVLFLHGAGERGDDLEKIKLHGIPKLINEGRTFPFICIAPQCPNDGYWDRPEYVSSLISLTREVEGEHRVDSNRIYGTGLSMGGLGNCAFPGPNNLPFAQSIKSSNSKLFLFENPFECSSDVPTSFTSVSAKVFERFHSFIIEPIINIRPAST